MTALLTVIIILAAVYAVWRIRFGTPSAGRPPVLCFHKVSDRFCWEGTWTTPRRFFAYIDRFLDLGYRFIGIDEYLAGMAAPVTGESDGSRELLLTFDDGYRELYTVVLPGMESRGVPFHVFLVTDYVGADNLWDLSLGRRPFRHLGWPEIEEMTSRGVTFGSHGATHADLTRLPAELIRDEIVRSKALIEDRLGRPAPTLSYPFGRYDDVVKKIVRESGYAAAFSLYPSHSNAHFDRYAIRRNGVYIIDPVRLVQSKVVPGPLYWCEEMKCRAINAVAVLTPVLKRRRGRRSSSPAQGN
jgi:peptidoglycan/xylan/chitin deacetylase (PgdA/CDA1 family)